jgi:hypothetical protein
MAANRDSFLVFVKILCRRARSLSGLYRFAKRLGRNIYWDMRIGGRPLGGTRRSLYEHLGAYNSANTDYDILSEVFGRAKLSSDDVIVDVGCAWGRVINYLLNKRLVNRIVGIELDPEIAAQTQHRLRHFPNVTIISGNVLDNIPPDGTVFYLFNPFNAEVMRRFSLKLKNLSTADRLLVLYYRCIHLDVFTQDSDWILVDEFEIERPESQTDVAAILRLKQSTDLGLKH